MPMQTKYWARRQNKQLGPFETREQAESAGQALFPKKPKYKDRIYTGYGEFGPSFDIRFSAPTST